MDDSESSEENADKTNRERNKFQPLDATTRIVLEKGRWIVMLNVPTWEPTEGEHPVTNNWNRINDYSTEKEAKVAASWIEKAANRDIRPPTGF